MKKVKIYSCWILLFLLIVTSFMSFYQIYSSPSLTQNDYSEDESYYRPQLAENSGIITINNNSDLKQAASSGNGSEVNPYIIEHKTIDGDGGLYCILINNTNKHFILEGCTLYNSTYGIYLNNATKAVVVVNFINNNFKSGIFILNSVNIKLQSNVIFDNKLYGILLVNSNKSKIESNTVLNNNISGICINRSIFNNISINSFDSHYQAILLQSSNYSVITDNAGEGNSFGIIELNCIENYFSGNNFKDDKKDRQEGENEKDFTVRKYLDFSFILFLLLSTFIGCIFIFKVYERLKNKFFVNYSL